MVVYVQMCKRLGVCICVYMLQYSARICLSCWRGVGENKFACIFQMNVLHIHVGTVARCVACINRLREMRTHSHRLTLTLTHLHTHTPTLTHTHTHTPHTQTHTHIHTHTHTHTCTICTHTYTHPHSDIQARTHTSTHLHT